MALKKISSPKLNQSLLKVPPAPITTQLDTIKNSNNVENLENQQQTYKAITELATHYVDLKDNNQYEIQKPIPLKNIDVIENIESSNLKVDLNARLVATNLISDAINANVSKISDVTISEPKDRVKIIDVSPPAERAVITAFLNDASPINLNVQIDEATTISTNSSALANVQTLETISPKILVAMQARAILSNNSETDALKQLNAYFSYHSLKVDLFSSFLIKIANDQNVRNLLTQAGAQKLEARSNLDSIDQILTIFSSVENEINSVFYLLGKNVAIGSPSFISSRGVSESSRAKLQQFINLNIQSSVNLEDLMIDAGFTGLKGSTQGLFILLQSLKNSVLYQTNKLNPAQSIQIPDEIVIPTPNYKNSSYQLDLPDDFTFESKLNSQLTLIDINSIISTISQTYGNYIKNFPSDIDTQIAVLLELPIKECRISSGINKNFNEISQKLGFTFTPGGQNVNVLNNLFGYIPNSVTNVPNQTTDKSISAYVQYKPVGTTSVVLPFEVSYLTKNNQVFNPINEYLYYRDLPILDAQSSNFFPTLADFSSKFTVFTKNVESSILKMGLIPYESEANINSDYDNFHSLDFFNKLSVKLKGPAKADPIAAIFSLAATDVNLRSALFYRCAFSFAGFRNSSTRFAYANQVNATNVIIDSLKKLTFTNNLQFFGRAIASTPLPIDQIIAAFDDKTGLVGEVLDLLSSASSFYKLQDVFSGNRTSFTSVDEMIIMMSLFHAIVLYINKTTNRYVTSVDANDSIVYVRTNPTNSNAQRFIPQDLIIQQKLLENSTSYIKQFYYLLQVLSSISISLSAISSITRTTQFVDGVAFIKQKLPANNLMQLVALSQSIRNSKYIIKQMRETVLPVSTVGNSSASPQINLQFFDPYVIDANQYEIVKEYSKNISNTSRILTIGIPLGTQRKLQIKSKQSNDPDVIRIKIHKIDQLNQSVTYKPIEFIFEMSRFVPYSKEKFKSRQLVTFTDVLELVPTFDISNAIQGYYDYPGAALTEARYNFLNPEQKGSLLKNHAISWCLSQYMRFFSGLNVSEQNFLSVPLTARSMSPEVLNAFFNSLPFSNTSSTGRLLSLDNRTGQVSATYATEHYTVVNELSRTTHIFSTAEHYVQKAITPSSFDRIFNVTFKDDDFVVDRGNAIRDVNESKFFTFYAEIESLGGS